MATIKFSIKNGWLKIICFINSDLQNIHLDIDIQIICGLEADIKIVHTYHIFGRSFSKMAAIEVIKMFCVLKTYT